MHIKFLLIFFLKIGCFFKKTCYICIVKNDCLTLKFIKMNKTELIAAVAKKAGLTKADTAKAFNALTEVTKETLKGGDKIALIGFGTFAMQNRPARKGKNPRTGKAIKIPAKKVLKFKASKKF